MAIERLDGGIRIENPGLGQQGRCAIIQMALKPLSAFVLSNGFEGAAHRILAHDLLHA
jgi:hypothetical protein